MAESGGLPARKQVGGTHSRRVCTGLQQHGHNLERANSRGCLNVAQRELQRQVSANEVSSQAGGMYSASVKSSLATQMASVEETSALRRVVETVDQLQKEMEDMRHTQKLEAEANRELLCSVLEEVKRSSRGGGIR